MSEIKTLAELENQLGDHLAILNAASKDAIRISPIKVTGAVQREQSRPGIIERVGPYSKDSSYSIRYRQS